MNNLHFYGPYSFETASKSDLADKECIYLWTFKQPTGSHLIHYIGETATFARRQREHLINVLGLYYGIWDAKKALNGSSEILWPGFWRLKGGKELGEGFRAYKDLNTKILDYATSISIFAAATNFEQNIRKHIEGTLAWSLRNVYPEHKLLYPDDNRTGKKPEKIGKTIGITSVERILGLAQSIQY